MNPKFVTIQGIILCFFSNVESSLSLISAVDPLSQHSLYALISFSLCNKRNWLKNEKNVLQKNSMMAHKSLLPLQNCLKYRGIAKLIFRISIGYPADGMWVFPLTVVVNIFPSSFPDNIFNKHFSDTISVFIIWIFRKIEGRVRQILVNKKIRIWRGAWTLQRQRAIRR